MPYFPTSRQLISLQIKGLKAVQKKQEQMLRDLHGTPMLNAMRDATLIVTRSAKRDAPVDRGVTRASIVPWVGMVGADTMGVVGSNQKTALWMELGTKPHWPPYAPIAAWVTRVLKPQKGMLFVVTRGVQRAIARHGTKARRFLLGAVEKNRSRIHRIIGTAVGRIVAK